MVDNNDCKSLMQPLGHVILFVTSLNTGELQLDLRHKFSDRQIAFSV